MITSNKPLWMFSPNGYITGKIINEQGNIELVYQHRWILEQTYGPLRNDIVVHHKNGIITDNELENLEMVSLVLC